jgi:hypothetical protein
MARVIALTAPTALRLSGASFHEPFHVDGGQRSMAVTERGDQNPPPRHRDLTAWPDRTVGPADLPLHCQMSRIWIEAAPLRSTAFGAPARSWPWRSLI